MVSFLDRNYQFGIERNWNNKNNKTLVSVLCQNSFIYIFDVQLVVFLRQ